MANKITIEEFVEIAEDILDTHFPKGDKRRGSAIALLSGLVVGLSKKKMIKKKSKKFITGAAPQQ